MTVYTTLSYAAELTMAWDANTEPDLKGYIVYYGTSSRNYDQSIDVGNVTTCTIPDLTEGQTYYIAATAYDTGLNESAYSEEISYTIPRSTAAYTITATAGGNGRIAPAGTISVKAGDSREFTIIPDNGYAIADVQVDGQSVGALFTYTFSNITADHHITVTFLVVTENRAPDLPELLYPADTNLDVSVTPLLEISGYADSDPNDDHGATRWQVATTGSFVQIILDITCDAVNSSGCLKSLLVPHGTLSGDQRYYWRARVKDARQVNSKWSEWSQPFEFSTSTPAYVDSNDNGVPDDIEPVFSDLDNDGLNDNDQPLMRVFTHSNSGSLVGIRAIEGVDRIHYFSNIDPGGMLDYNKPDHLPYGLMNFNLQVNQIGGMARLEIILSAAVDGPVGWYKYDPVNGWYEFSVSGLSAKYTLEISDGGYGDTDGVANGIIVDPIGIASAGDTRGGTSSEAATGGGGCFILTSTPGGNGYHVLILFLVSITLVGCMRRKADIF